MKFTIELSSIDQAIILFQFKINRLQNQTASSLLDLRTKLLLLVTTTKNCKLCLAYLLFIQKTSRNSCPYMRTLTIHIDVYDFLETGTDAIGGGAHVIALIRIGHIVHRE